MKEKFMKEKDTKKPELYYWTKKAVNVDHLPEVKGYDFEKEFDFTEFLESFKHFGLQATELSNAIGIVKAMRRENAHIFLTFTSNMVSSGMRDLIKYLVKNKKIHAIVTSAGAIEEDIMKSMMPFRLGDFHVKGEPLLDAGIGRIGNIFATNDHYAYFDKFLQRFFKKMHSFQKEKQTFFTASEFIRELGLSLENEENMDYKSSYLYWAAKNDIPVFCPGLVDGAIGDILYFYKTQNPDFVVDIMGDTKEIVNICLNAEKTGALVLGGGIAKHYTLNANIFREGLDFAVYISTANFFDGSDSGGNQEEAITWAKIKPNAPRAKVCCEASIVFPLIVAGAFRD